MNFHWLSVGNIMKYHIDLFFLRFFSVYITKNNFPAPSQRVAHCAKRDESPVLVVYPAGGNGEGERRRVCVCGDAVAYSRLTSFTAN